MKEKAHPLTIARRIIPYVIVRYLLIPLTTYVIMLGWGVETGREYHRLVSE